MTEIVTRQVFQKGRSRKNVELRSTIFDMADVQRFTVSDLNDCIDVVFYYSPPIVIMHDFDEFRKLFILSREAQEVSGLGFHAN
jgi:hypothetical protein